MIGLLQRFYSRVRTAYQVRKYDPYTMADYLRRSGAQIGEHCNIISTSLGTEPYLIRIGNHVAIAHGVRFITHDGGTWLFREEVPDLQVFGPIVIEDNCVIGENAVLFPGIRIGPNSIVGAGSVVITDVPPNTIAMGVPARPFGSVEKYKEKCLEKWKRQRPDGVTIEPGATWWNSRYFADNREKLRRHLLELFESELRHP